jgi:guanylate kinase
MERLHFTQPEEFKQHIKNDDFLEWEEVTETISTEL